MSARDVKARYNLSWIHARERDFPAALRVIAEALALDETGEYFERLLKKQSEIVGALNQRNQLRQLLLANRVSKRTSEPAASPAGASSLDGAR